MAASQAIAFLNTIGAKKPNVYFRAGRKPKLTWVLKGKTFGVELDVDDAETGANAILQIRDIIQRTSEDSMAAKTMQAMVGHDYNLGGIRLKYVREQATLKRQSLSHMTAIDTMVLKDLEESQTPNLEDHLNTEDIIKIAKACNADPNWLAGREIVETPAPIHGEPPEDGADEIVDVPAAAPPILTIVDDDRAVIGARIKQARADMGGLSQAALGEIFDVSGVTISLMERGNPSRLWAELPKIAEVLHVTEIWLRTGSETGKIAEPTPDSPAPEPSPIVEGGGVDHIGIGERIRLARNAKGMTQVDLADMCGVSPIMVSNAENGRTTVLAIMIDEIADYLDCTEAWLDTGEGDPPYGVTMPGTNSAVKPSILLKSGQTRVTETLPAPVQRPYRAPAPVAVAKPPVATERSVAPVDTLRALQAHIDKRLDAMASMALLRHEELRAAVELQTRWSKAVYRMLKGPAEAEARKPKTKKEKNPNRVEAGKRMWETLKGQTAAPEAEADAESLPVAAE